MGEITSAVGGPLLLGLSPWQEPCLNNGGVREGQGVDLPALFPFFSSLFLNRFLKLMLIHKAIPPAMMESHGYFSLEPRKKTPMRGTLFEPGRIVGTPCDPGMVIRGPLLVITGDEEFLKGV